MGDTLDVLSHFTTHSLECLFASWYVKHVCPYVCVCASVYLHVSMYVCSGSLCLICFSVILIKRGVIVGSLFSLSQLISFPP